jgi:hypothetical protein
MGNDPFKEIQYPELDKFLSEGYGIKEVIPVVTNSSSSYMYSLTFILVRL